jgi:hypothetical protein
MPDVNLKAAVFKTLAFFDIFNFPLTTLEIEKYLYGASGSLVEIEEVLANLPLVKSHEGFYFLSGRSEEMIAGRKLRYNLAEKKFKKLKHVGWFLALMPFVRLIAVCNTLAYSNAKEESDIDLFVVAKKGKTWTVRFFCLWFLKIFGLRPTAPRTQNKFCLSFFVDEEHLNLKEITLPRDDIYLWYWLAQLYPVYDSGGVYARFWRANTWLKEYLPQVLPVTVHPRREIRLGGFWRAVRFFKELVWNFAFWEKIFKNIQLRGLPPILKDKVNRDPGVMIKDGIIKLISNDRREAYRNEWVAKVSALIDERW